MLFWIPTGTLQPARDASITCNKKFYFLDNRDMQDAAHLPHI